MRKNANPIEIIKSRLYWVSDDEPPKNIQKSFYFNIDKDLVYENFNKDFGPLSLGKTWRYVNELKNLLAHQQYKNHRIYHYTSTNFQKVANSVYLMCAFQVFALGYDAETAWEPFKSIQTKPFRDALNGECSYKCTILHCIKGLEYAIKIGWFNFNTFNVAEYEHYEKLQNGDLNWIIPQKFVAFSSPYQEPADKYGNKLLTPHEYVPIFKKIGVTTVIRLNNKTYKSQHFIKKDIEHHQLFFADGSVPQLGLIYRFLQISEKTQGALAVHCKAGLGRTGTLIACYAMKHYYFPADAFIGWIRIVRPGSILGPQQLFLIQMQSKMRQYGAKSQIWAKIRELVDQKYLITSINNLRINEMNQRQLQISKHGEKDQGQNLVRAKLNKEISTKMEKVNHSKQRCFNSRSNSTSRKSSPNDKKKK